MSRQQDLRDALERARRDLETIHYSLGCDIGCAEFNRLRQLEGKALRAIIKICEEIEIGDFSDD